MTKNEIQIGVALMIAVSQAVEKAKRLPEGHVYATMMDCVTLPAFESLVQQLCKTGLIKRENNELVWIG